MKLTRRLLRKLIIEAIIDEANTKRYISSPDGDVIPADLAALTAQGKDLYAADVHPNIGKLVQSDDFETRVQGRELADAYADEDSEFAQIDRMTPGEETAIDHIGYEKSFEEGGDLEYPIDKELLYGAMKSKSKGPLKHFGFMYIEDAPHLVPETDYEDMGDMFRFQAKALGCDIDDLAFVDGEDPVARKSYYAILDFMSEMDRSKKSYVPIPEDKGYFGSNETYNLDGLLVLFTSHMGGYYTATICGK